MNKMNTSKIRYQASLTAKIVAILLCLGGAAKAVDVAPPPSVGHKMVYDTARQQIVLYGITLANGTTSTQTWVWNGGWSLMTPAASPPGNYFGGMAYDAARQRAVFYGGAVGLYNTNGTWTWDGTNWAAATPATRPPARYDVAMTYDSAGAVTLLFGGNLRTNNTSLANTNDTWVWSGSDWMLKAPTNAPSPRCQYGLAFDAARGEVVLFGGVNNTSGGGTFSDTWTWNGTDWTQKSPTSHPPALDVSGMVYDSVRQEVLLFGGLPSSGGNNSTYAWNGTNWSQKSPLVQPPQLYNHAMAFDPVRGEALLFGGIDHATSGSPLAGTWLWDGTNWYSSDMTLTMATLPNTVFLGSNVTYTVVVTNKGPSVAEEVMLVDELPTSVEFVTATVSQGSWSYSNGVVRCSLGLVQTVTNVIVSIVATPLAIGGITNVATVLCAAEFNPSNNVASVAATVVSPPVLSAPLTNQTAAAGGQFTLSVSVSGSSPLSYQWFFNVTNLVAQGTPWLSFTNLDWSDAGYYTVVVSNPWGIVTNTALLSMDDLHMYAGIRIGGAPGITYQVAARDSLSTNDTWSTLTNLALPYSPYLFIDEDSPNHPQRFYRVTVMP